MGSDWTNLPHTSSYIAQQIADNPLVICSSAGSASWRRLCQSLISIIAQACEPSLRLQPPHASEESPRREHARERKRANVN
jgi:hypothetical protein